MDYKVGGVAGDDGGECWRTAAEPGYHGTLQHPHIRFPSHRMNLHSHTHNTCKIIRVDTECV